MLAFSDHLAKVEPVVTAQCDGSPFLFPRIGHRVADLGSFGRSNFTHMTTTFWSRRTLVVLALSFALIASAQYMKTKDLRYAMTQAALWGGISTIIYLLVLWRKLKKHPVCAANTQDKDA